jgi:glucose/arabinose dehydrogenase
MKCSRLLCLALLALVASSGCVGLSPSRGGGQTAVERGRHVNPADVAVPAGYRVEVVATGLNMPTGVAFDDDNRPIVVEAGYSYGEVFTTPRIVRVERDGRVSVLASGGDTVPWTGVDYRDGTLYVAEGGQTTGGRISRLDADDGKLVPLVADLPSRGDHHTNGPAISPDGAFVYFAVGTATNSGVVGQDNVEFGWAKRFPDFCDIPARDIKLAGENFSAAGGKSTGAYVPLGTQTKPGQIINGRLPCTGAVMRVPARGGKPELVAWGLRNPFGLAFAPDGRLLVAENSYDDRGSRPVWGTGDVLRSIDVTRPPLWYGWPDFHGDRPLTWDDHYQPPGKPAPKFLLAEHPNKPPAPAAKLGVHGAAGALDVSRSARFGYTGEAFVAMFGDMAPKVGKVVEPVGYQIVRVDPQSGVIEAFAVNHGKKNGPASKLKHGGLERPLAARFDRTGDALYIVDFGIMTVDASGPKPRQGTGVLWRVSRAEVSR